jgi:hypothetical protein
MTVHFKAASTFVLALLATAALASAPQAVPGPILSKADLQQAMSASGGPDHAKLAAHYKALAGRYAADATRHAEMAKGYSTNTSRAGGPDMRGHCLALANLNAGMEKSARELAKFHADRAGAAGKGASPDGDGSQADHAKMEGMAEKVPAIGDHSAVMSYFGQLADRYTADADTHAAMAAAYRTGRMAGMADHCERLARDARAAAKRAREAAGQHAQP